MNKIKKGFTLVELLVVVSILAVLGTLAFLSFQGYSKDARDSIRVSDIKNIEKSLQLYIVDKGELQKPDDYIEITASGVLIGYQGYAGQKTLNAIGVRDGGRDPLDDTFYTYYLNVDLEKYQLLGFLEDADLSFQNFNKANASLEERYFYSRGSSLGILLDEITNEPIQDKGIGVDVFTTGTGYKVKLNNSSTGEFSGTGDLLSVELDFRINAIGSCNNILKSGKSRGDGVYKIDPDENGIGFDVYCDMTTDGGGWTMLAHAVDEGTSVFNYDDILSWTPKNSDNCSTDTECLSESGVKLQKWNSLMVYTRGYKVKGTKCNDKNKTIKGYTELPLLGKVSITNWDSLSYGAHGKCDELFEVSQGLTVSELSTHPSPWPIRMGVRFNSNDSSRVETSLLSFGPTFMPQGLGNELNGSYKMDNGWYGDKSYQANDWDGASTLKQTWFVR